MLHKAVEKLERQYADMERLCGEIIATMHVNLKHNRIGLSKKVLTDFKSITDAWEKRYKKVKTVPEAADKQAREEE